MQRCDPIYATWNFFKLYHRHYPVYLGASNMNHCGTIIFYRCSEIFSYSGMSRWFVRGYVSYLRYVKIFRIVPQALSRLFRWFEYESLRHNKFLSLRHVSLVRTRIRIIFTLRENFSNCTTGIVPFISVVRIWITAAEMIPRYVITYHLQCDSYASLV